MKKTTITTIIVILYSLQTFAIVTLEDVTKKMQKYHDIEIYDTISVSLALDEISRWADEKKIDRINLFCTKDTEICDNIKNYITSKDIPFRHINNSNLSNNKIRIIYYTIVKTNTQSKKDIGSSVAHNMIDSIQDITTLTKSSRIKQLDKITK